MSLDNSGQIIEYSFDILYFTHSQYLVQALIELISN